MDLPTPIGAPKPRTKFPVKPADRKAPQHEPAKNSPSMKPDTLELSAPPKPPEPLRTAEEVIQGGRKTFLIPQGSERAGTADSWRSVQEKAWSVKLYRDKSIWYNGDYLAESELRANTPMIRQAVAELSPQQQAQYQEISAVLADLNNGPRLALEMMLVSGQLTRPDASGNTLLGGLAALAQQPLHEAIDRGMLVGGLTIELALPVTISQQNSGTCTVTSLEVKMALERPTEFLRLVAGLASPEGKVRLANGEDLVRLPGTEAAAEIVRGGQPGEDGRTPSSRLWQSAMMDFADGPEQTYNVRTDLHEGPKGNGKSGLFDSQTDKAYSAVTNERYQTLTVGHRLEAQELYQRLQERTSAGERIPTSFKWNSRESSSAETGQHMVLVSKVDETGIQLENPWGERNFIPKADALQLLSGAHLRKP